MLVSRQKYNCTLHFIVKDAKILAMTLKIILPISPVPLPLSLFFLLSQQNVNWI